MRSRPLVLLGLIAALAAFGVGLGLGIAQRAGERTKPPAALEAPAAPATPLATEEAAARSAPAAPSEGVALPAAAFPGLAADPFGPHADAGESWRVLRRMSLDLLRRPPTRAEERELLPLSHRERWERLRRRALAERRPLDGIRRSFERFLGRAPKADEIAALSRWSEAQLAELGLHLSATREYRDPAFERDRDLEQLARSLLVDLADREPQEAAELGLIGRAVVEGLGLDELARSILLAAALEAPELEARRAWILAECRRFLRAAPADEQVAALEAALAESSDACRWLRAILAAAPEYRRY